MWFSEASGADYAPAVGLTPRGVPYARFRNKRRDIGAARFIDAADRGPSAWVGADMRGREAEWTTYAGRSEYVPWLPGRGSSP